jgi:hypothetical protein
MIQKYAFIQMNMLKGSLIGDFLIKGNQILGKFLLNKVFFQMKDIENVVDKSFALI